MKATTKLQRVKGQFVSFQDMQ